jgi:lactate dehydrogenase-like 2-hydroxyacid dehydrogenase
MDKKYKKVVVLDSVIFYPEHKDRLNKIAKEVVEYNTCETEEEVLDRVKGADCIISCWVDIPNKVIDENPQLKTIAFWTHAFEHRIDKNYALKHNLHVPSIPDYGTDSVAELAFIGLLQLYKNEEALSLVSANNPRKLQEEIMAKVTDDVRKFNKNWRDNLRGSWTHEYVKAGKLKITSPDEFKEETLKGLTVGLLVNDNLKEDLFKIASSGFHMNAIYSLSDLPHALDIAFRPIDNLLRESNIIIYDSRFVNEEIKNKIKNGNYLSVVDVAEIIPKGESLMNKKIGIVGLGRIGGRVAQIARDGFNMDVSYYSTNRNPELEKQYNLKYKPLEKILTESDVITFHLPHVGAEKFITKEMISMIPKKTTVVNVSVGSIFQDQSHFFSRFEKDDLNGYVDVYDTLPPREELRNRKKFLVATYRLGWRTKSTIGLKTHKLLTRLKEGLYR